MVKNNFLFIILNSYILQWQVKNGANTADQTLTIPRKTQKPIKQLEIIFKINKNRQNLKEQKSKNKKKQAAEHQPILSTANIPKAKKGSQLQKQVQQYRDSVIHQGKSAIHRLIAQRTQGLYGAPIQFPDKQDLVLAQNYENKSDGQQNDESNEQENFQMWKVDICESTGDPCFINRITKAILYQPPKGYLLSQSQKQQWEYLQQLCKQKVKFDPDQEVIISQWQQVPDDENYFNVNKVQSQNQQDKSNENISLVKKEINQQVLKKYLNQKQQRQAKQQKSKQEMQINQSNKKFNNQSQENNLDFQSFKNVKQKNEAFKKLIQHGIQIRSAQPIDISMGQDEENQTSFKGFKARKKVKITNNSIIQDEDGII